MLALLCEHGVVALVDDEVGAYLRRTMRKQTVVGITCTVSGSCQLPNYMIV